LNVATELAAIWGYMLGCRIQSTTAVQYCEYHTTADEGKLGPEEICAVPSRNQ